MKAPESQMLQNSRRVGGHSLAIIATQNADARNPAHGRWKGGNDIQYKAAPTNAKIQLRLNFSEIAPLAPFMGKGLGLRLFSLFFDWSFDRGLNAYPRFKSINKSLDRSSTPHPQTPSLLETRRGGEKLIGFDRIRFDSDSIVSRNVGNNAASARSSN